MFHSCYNVNSSHYRLIYYSIAESLAPVFVTFYLIYIKDITVSIDVSVKVLNGKLSRPSKTHSEPILRIGAKVSTRRSVSNARFRDWSNWNILLMTNKKWKYVCAKLTFFWSFSSSISRSRLSSCSHLTLFSVSIRAQVAFDSSNLCCSSSSLRDDSDLCSWIQQQQILLLLLLLLQTTT